MKNENKLKSVIILLCMAAVLITLDQTTKSMVRSAFGDGSSFSIIDGVLRLCFTKNSGAAWGIFNEHVNILAVVSVVLSVGLFVCYIRLPMTKRYRPLRYTLIFVIAGAVGNGIDRIFSNYVTDFIYFELIDFPVFNVADCYITIGMILLVILLLFYYKDEDFTVKKVGADKAESVDADEAEKPGEAAKADEAENEGKNAGEEAEDEADVDRAASGKDAKKEVNGAAKKDGKNAGEGNNGKSEKKKSRE